MTSETSLPSDQDIRFATASDSQTVAEILSSAFTNDPVLTWFCREPRAYARLFMSEINALYRHHRHIFINESQTGAAMWLPPNVSAHVPFGLGSLSALWALLRYAGLEGLNRGGMLEKAMSEVHLKEPHFYLHAIGARLDCQGRGIGSALLKHGTRICDERKFPAYLESSNVKNNPLYERFGFEITGEITMPDDGPTLWLMRRPAVA